MAPTIILKDGKPIMVVGSPGGSTIPTVVLQVIVNYINFGMDIQEAIDAPRIHHQWLPDIVYYEEYGLPSDVLTNLTARGYHLGGQRELGRAEGISAGNKGNIFEGATDPRGFGKAAGF